MTKCKKYMVLSLFLSVVGIVSQVANAVQLSEFRITRDCKTKQIVQVHFSGVTFPIDQFTLQKITIVSNKSQVLIQTSVAQLPLGEVESSEACDFYSQTKTSTIKVDSHTKVIFNASLVGSCGPGSLEGSHESLREGSVAFISEQNREVSKLDFSYTASFYDSACRVPMF
jgi:hypothetical protein